LGQGRLQQLRALAPTALICTLEGGKHRGYHMAYSVTFKRGDQVLERYEFEVENPEVIRAFIDEAHVKFHKAHPGTSIFDGITVIYDKD